MIVPNLGFIVYRIQQKNFLSQIEKYRNYGILKSGIRHTFTSGD